MVNKAQQESQASKGLRVPMVNKDLRVPMVNKDLRVRRGLRDPRAIPVTLVLRGLRVRRGLRVPMVNKDLRVRRGLRVRAARLMVRHARMRPALLEPWFQVPTPRVCFLRTA